MLPLRGERGADNGTAPIPNQKGRRIKIIFKIKMEIKFTAIQDIFQVFHEKIAPTAFVDAEGEEVDGRGRTCTEAGGRGPGGSSVSRARRQTCASVT